MNPKVLEYIKHLSKTDKKNLTQKALKTAEEVGELAAAALPYDSAYATNHRFVEKEKILEEAVDTILCALSVAYDLNFTDDQIEQMMKRKADKWALLQKGEERATFPLAFEIHITVDFKGRTREEFETACRIANVKAVLIDNIGQNNEIVFVDALSSSTHIGTNASAYEEAKRIERSLWYNSFKAVRSKIETVPWHPAAPRGDNRVMPKNCYFEAHIPIVTVKREPVHQFAKMIKKDYNLDVHLSTNVLKDNDGEEILMLTYRTYEGTEEEFTRGVNVIKKLAEENSLAVGKIHKEFSVYDTNVSHDAAWMLKQ